MTARWRSHLALRAPSTSPARPHPPISRSARAPIPSPAADSLSGSSTHLARYSTPLIPVSTGGAIVDSAGDAYITGILSAGQAFTPTPGAVGGLPSIAPKQYKTGYLLELDPTGSRAVLAIQGFGGRQIALDSETNIYLMRLVRQSAFRYHSRARSSPPSPRQFAFQGCSWLIPVPINTSPRSIPPARNFCLRHLSQRRLREALPTASSWTTPVTLSLPATLGRPITQPPPARSSQNILPTPPTSCQDPRIRPAPRRFTSLKLNATIEAQATALVDFPGRFG